MTLGDFQLRCIDKQNIILNGHPEDTLFKSVFFRISNFGIQTNDHLFNQETNFDSLITTNISKSSGELLSKCYLEIQLPEISTVVTGTLTTNEYVVFEWVDSIAYFLIDYINLIIDGTEIEKKTGKWMYIWNELTIKKELKNTINLMIGGNLRTDLRTTLTSGGNTTLTIIPNNKLYLPLQCFFCNDYNNVLPLISIINNVQFNIKLNSLSTVTNVYVKNTINEANVSNVLLSTPYISNGNLDIKLVSDTILLDVFEKRLFSINNHSLLFTQVQTITETYTNTKNISINLKKIVNPIKEIVFTINTKTALTKGQYYSLNDYTNNGNDILIDSTIFINSTKLEDTKNALFLNKLNSLIYHNKIIKDGIYILPFCFYPENYQPSGSYDFSNIQDITLVLNLSTTEEININIYAITYNNLKITEGQIGLNILN